MQRTFIFCFPLIKIEECGACFCLPFDFVSCRYVFIKKNREQRDNKNSDKNASRSSFFDHHSVNKKANTYTHTHYIGRPQNGSADLHHPGRSFVLWF